jgi:hypothetical protein
MTTKNKFDGYQPRHVSDINYDFCLNGCLEVDGITVPFPDCGRHGNRFTRDPKCGTIEVCP